ncbi:MAG TPA: iduronate-2-sulfatase [Flavobacteriales bacterium]|nr:iduronate-2-sulfatase [Flavobacteriales bacterium]
MFLDGCQARICWRRTWEEFPKSIASSFIVLEPDMVRFAPQSAWRLLSVVALGFMVSCAPSEKEHLDATRNVLLLVADDLNCMLGCYGDSLASTPNLDALASEGIRFDQAHCQYPLCGPSRTSFLTGLYPSQSGVRENRVMLRDAMPEVVTLPQLFRQHGYHVTRVGKLFHYDNPGEIGTSGQDDNPSWDETYNPSGRDKREEHLIHSLVEGKFGGTLSWLSSQGDEEEHTDGMVASLTVEKLRVHAQSQQPFFLAAGFFRPHTPFVAPSAFFELHPREDVVVPDYADASLSKLPSPSKRSIRGNRVQVDLAHDTAQMVIQAYRASVSFVDAQVGRVLRALKETGLEDNTLVVFLSDHGYHLGEHGHWQKQTLFEEATRVPFILRNPDELNSHAAEFAPVELVDLYPTVAAWAGLVPPAQLPGRNVLQPRETEDQVSPGAYTEWRKGSSLRTARHRITRWGNEGELGWELYDHQADPSELDNLAGQLDMGPIMDSLQQVLIRMDSSHKVVPEGVGLVNPLARPLPRVAPVLKRPSLESSES